MKALNARYLGSGAAEKEFIHCSSTLRSLLDICLDICQALRKKGIKGLEEDDILRLAKNKLLDDSVQEISNDLPDDSLLLLSLLTWHFDSTLDYSSPESTPSQGLLQFFVEPSNVHEVFDILRKQYCRRVEKEIGLGEFEKEFMHLLGSLKSKFRKKWTSV
ncbi:hypothetical protein BDV41DRAFT_578985 [Aspergillus transmontanensis]|uniref:Uncharacterized protein n=1 Tax=Aspergillus transmontanensis TaxID=1034304 RepID=A0A5N6VQZ4_9EURO|nr:hypothetical protein BDV41DRAFT_578985 [Aspergillus transmontanensis]